MSFPIIINFLEKELGVSKIGLSGISFGGHLACFAKSLLDRQDTLCIPMMSWTDSSPVWTDGLLADTIAYQDIEKILRNDRVYDEILSEVQDKEPDLKIWNYQFNPVPGRDDRSLPLLKYKYAVEMIRKYSSKFSDLSLISVPQNTELVKFLVAKNDAYYPQLDTIAKAEEMWPGCEVIAYDNLGHVEGYIRAETMFAKEVEKSFALLDDRCPSKKSKSNSNYTEKLEKLLSESPKGDKEVWIDNKVKLMAIVDPVVVFAINILKAAFRVKDAYLYWKK